MDFETKVATFMSALFDVYRDEEERQMNFLPRIELKEETLIEDFTCMIYAIMMFYKQVTNDNIDALGFSHICNRLVFQQICKDHGIKLGEAPHE